MWSGVRSNAARTIVSYHRRSSLDRAIPMRGFTGFGQSASDQAHLPCKANCERNHLSKRVHL